MPWAQETPTDSVSRPEARWWVASWNGQTTFAYTLTWMMAREMVAVELGISNDYAGLITIPVLLAQFPESYFAPRSKPGIVKTRSARRLHDARKA